MNLYITKDDYYDSLVANVLKDVYEINYLSNSKNIEIDPNKIFDSNFIIHFNNTSINNNINNICSINIIYDCKLFPLQFEPNLNYYIIYVNNDNCLDNTFTHNLNNNYTQYDLKIILNKIFFNWFNYKNVFELKIHKNIKKIKNIIDSDSNYNITTIKKTDIYNREIHNRTYTLVKYLNTYGMDGVNYYANFHDNFNNFNWVKNLNFPIFGYNRHFTNKKSILFQLENYHCKNTLLSYKIKINEIPFNEKNNNKCVGYFSQMGSCTRDDNWYQFELLNNTEANTYDNNFLCLSNFDRFSFCYKYINNDLFEIGLLNNNKSQIITKFFPWLIKDKKDLNYLNKSLFHIYLNGNDTGTSIFWQLLYFNVVFIPYPFEYQNIFMYGLQPYVHFVPISNKFFDIEDKLKFMMNNIELCKKIAHYSHNYIKIFIENNCDFLDLISIETIKIYNTFLVQNS